MTPVATLLHSHAPRVAVPTPADPQQRLVIPLADSGVLLAVIPDHPRIERPGDANHFTDEGFVWMLGEQFTTIPL